MSPEKSDRSVHFPAIEKKHGKPIGHWLKEVKGLGASGYQEQLAHLLGAGFSRTHANAVVMYARGSRSARRFDGPEDYFQKLDPAQAITARRIVSVIKSKHPGLELVVAWNQPMWRMGKDYVFGISAAKNHLLIAPFGNAALKKCAVALKDYEVNKKTIRVPSDWKVDARLVLDLIGTRIKEVKGRAASEKGGK
jgi:uncharacterized protein